MQSGPIVAVRAVVMLACMIVVPMVAIFWKHWPQAIDLARDGRWTELAELGADIVTKSGPQPTTAHNGTQDAPSFAANASSHLARTAAADAATTQGNPFASPNPVPPPMMAGAAATSSTEVPAAPAAPIVAPAAYQSPVPDMSSSAIGSPIPDPVEMPAHLAPETATQATPIGQEPPQGNPFRDMEQRLRTLGATYYLLESWGMEGNLYRFHVKMAMAGNPNYNRHFEATDADPIAAMSRVLTEVEAWRSGRQP